MKGHSSLGALVADHTATGSHTKHSIPRAESDPEPDTYKDSPPPCAKPIREHAFKMKRGIVLGMLSPGDYFTTRITRRYGMVLSQNTKVLPSTYVLWLDSKHKTHVGQGMIVLAGLWIIEDPRAQVTPC